jgi:hypothetical protein
VPAFTKYTKGTDFSECVLVLRQGGTQTKDGMRKGTVPLEKKKKESKAAQRTMGGGREGGKGGGRGQTFALESRSIGGGVGGGASMLRDAFAGIKVRREAVGGGGVSVGESVEGGVSTLRDAFLSMPPNLNPGKRERAEASIFPKVLYSDCM